MNFIKKIIEQRKQRKEVISYLYKKIKDESTMHRHHVSVQWYDTGHITNLDVFAACKEAVGGSVQQIYLERDNPKKLNVDYGIVNIQRGSDK